MTKWISAKEKLPPKDKEDPDVSIHVLITEGQHVGIGYLKYEYFSPEDEPHEIGKLAYSSELWHDLSDTLLAGYSGWPDVTHWAKLPKLPKKT